MSFACPKLSTCLFPSPTNPMGYLISKEFPSRFLSGDEIAGKVTDVVIQDVKKEMAFSPKTNRNESCLVVYFEGKDRGIRLGKERAMELTAITGSDDTDQWKGARVRIYTEKKYALKRNLNVLHFAASEPESIPS